MGIFPQVCEEFKAIARVLYDKPNSIEELSEQREYMKQIPEKLKKNQELIDKAMVDYELIEEFNYSISAEDFNAKYVARRNSRKLVFNRKLCKLVNQLLNDG